MDHSAACPSAPCPITEDVQISCQGDRLGELGGLRVAPAPNTTWLSTSSDADQMLFRISGGSAERSNHGLLHSGLLALDNEGALHMAYTETPLGVSPSNPPFAAHAVLRGNTWTSERVYADFGRQYSGTRVDAFEIAQDNQLYLWGSGGVTGAQLMTKKPAAPSWTDSPIWGGALYGEMGYTVINDGSPVALGIVRPNSGALGDLYVQLAGENIELSRGLIPDSTYRVTHAPPPSSDASVGPNLATVTQASSGLSVAWLTPDGVARVDLPGTTFTPSPEESIYVGVKDPVCASSSRYVAAGVALDEYNIARTSDGSIWAAYIYTEYDVQHHYEAYCDVCSTDDCCSCNRVIEQDDSRASLHLVRIDTITATAREVLVVPMAPLQMSAAFRSLPSWRDPRMFDMRGFGKNLAIGLRTRSKTVARPNVRVLRIDTSTLTDSAMDSP
jgi:hypothetical protein